MIRFSRRHLCAIFSSTIAFSNLPLFAQDAVEKNVDRSPDDWLLEWKEKAKTNKDLQGPLDLRRFKDPFYVLLNEIGWKPKQVNIELQAFQVPKGFVTDFASVPRLFWSIFPPDGRYAYAAVLHDWLYWTQDRTKKDSDRIFRLAMDDLTITDSQAAILYQAVNVLGGFAWEKNAELKLNGEKRVLTKFSENPKSTWIDWKKLPGVFE